jgi:hypothetical protein
MASFHIFFPNALFTVAHLVSGNYSWVADSVIKQTPNWHIEEKLIIA